MSGEANRANGAKALGKRRLARSVALVGLMGAGKSSVGRRLAAQIGAPFRDLDEEIERAAGLGVSEIFEQFGEQYFRDGEHKVVARLLDEPPHILATGGGAYMNAETRRVLRERAHTLWLKADLDTLAARCARKNDRPLLQSGDPREILAELIQQRYPIYAQADSVVESRGGPHEVVVRAALSKLTKAGVLVSTAGPSGEG